MADPLSGIAGRGIRPGGDLPPTWVSRMIAVAVLCGYSAVLVLNVLRDGPGPGKLAGCLACVTAVCAVQLLLLSPRARAWPLRRGVPVLAVQAALAFAPLAWFGPAWAPVGGILGASLLLLLPRRVAWGLFALVVAVIGGYAALSDLPLVSRVYAPLIAVLTGLVLHGLTLLTDLVRALHTTRAELARAAVAQERRRIARDVHDLLGYSLSAITLKCELIHRLVPVQPGRALDEVESVLAVSRQAVADARLVASGYRDMSLADEAEAAVEVMAAAGIRTTMDISCGRLHPAVDTVLATALREGVTNILRHSKARVCDIRAVREGESVRLVLVNDGVLTEGRTAASHGSGLDNLRARADAVGGRLTAMVRDDGRFRLVAKVPVRPLTAPAATTAVREIA
ncbi:sensor histidine kinase [Streptomyces sp. 4F14]|uniref:sensor histidine kinase n=1 Tax=Streptomyces sp. 4F14 TaxID=3394380 RepID=UPI003A892293